MIKKGTISLIIIIASLAGYSQYSYFNHYKGWGIDVAVGYSDSSLLVCPAYVKKMGRYYYRVGIEYASDSYAGLLAGMKVYPFENRKRIRTFTEGMFEFVSYFSDDYANAAFVMPGLGVDYELSKEFSVGTNFLVGPGVIWEKYISTANDPDYDPGVEYVPKWSYRMYFLFTLEYTLKKRSHRGKI